jgi:hypothetical protein
MEETNVALQQHFLPNILPLADTPTKPDKDNMRFFPTARLQIGLPFWKRVHSILFSYTEKIKFNIFLFVFPMLPFAAPVYGILTLKLEECR